MTLEIIFGVIAICVLVLTIVSLVVLQRLCKVMRKIDRCFKKEKNEDHSGLGKIADLLKFISDGVHLFSKYKNEMKQ